MNKKILLFVVLVLWSALIFSFSSQRAEDSASLSRDLAKKVITTIEKVFGIDVNSNADDEDGKAGRFFGLIEHYLRKTAHFFLFMVLGIISSALAGEYSGKYKYAFAVALLYCLFYAASDEIHQLFVPGRAGMLRDVALDFCGSAVGSIIYIKTRKH